MLSFNKPVASGFTLCKTATSNLALTVLSITGKTCWQKKEKKILYLSTFYWWVLWGKKGDCKPNIHFCVDWHFQQQYLTVKRLHQSVWQLDVSCWQLFLKQYKMCAVRRKLNLYCRMIKNKSTKTNINKFQPCSGSYPQLNEKSPFNREQIMERINDEVSVFHFPFLLFRAFHSPSWVAKLPKSSFTFLFLSASLKRRTCQMLEAVTKHKTLWLTST